MKSVLRCSPHEQNAISVFTANPPLASAEITQLSGRDFLPARL
jgi:hypothetical protein